MSFRRTIGTILLVATYFSATCGGSLLVTIPAAGSGNPAIHTSTGHRKGVSPPYWTPRRHLPNPRTAFSPQCVPSIRVTPPRFTGCTGISPQGKSSVLESPCGLPPPERAPPPA